MDLSQHALQSWQLFPCSGAGHVRSLSWLDTVDVHGHCFTGPWLIICDDILMIKFGGTLAGSISFKNCASRVGIQCCVELVRLHTSNIFSRCLRLWMSPESCHLKYFSPVINTTMASTHRGSSRACNLRFRAACTFLNLYLPFRA
jgi:hypothetical protein